MIILRLLLLFALFAGLQPLTLAGTRDPNTPDERYIEFGKKFPSVMRIMSVGEEKDEETGETQPTPQFGSAVVIKPNWILTAAHVVHNTQATMIIADSGTTHMVTRLFIPKEFSCNKNHFGYYDIAIGYMPEGITLDFYPELYTDSDEPGKLITFAGHGFTGTFETGYKDHDGKKRAGHNKIDSTERGVLVCTPSIGTGKTALEYMISPGDSGGGMFIGNKLAGINSFLMARDQKPNGTYGDESAFTRISLYADWVNSQIESYELFLAGRTTTGANTLVEIEAPDFDLHLVDADAVVLP